MPYWYRRRYYPRRRFYSWRPRKTFWRRRRRWRKRRPVRRKLKKIHLQQYQPDTIRKCTIKGLHALIIGNAKRLGNNYRQYEQSLTPEFWPGGGGFSITKYTLDALFEQRQLVRNWWTKPNKDLPLVRYTGCKFKLYKSDNIDYVVVPFTCYPMIATENLYTSCQPSIQLMNSSRIIVPSKKTQPKGKPYKTLRLHPPSQMNNRWYFAKDLATTGLAMLTTTAVSLDNYYISNYQESTSMSFYSLNPIFFKKHNFQEPGATGYLPVKEGTTEKRMWGLQNGEHEIKNIKFKDLIFLGNTKKFQKGLPMSTTTPYDKQNLKQHYFTDSNKWGNPFYIQYLITELRVLVSTKTIDTLLDKYVTNGNQDKKIEETDFTFSTIHELQECRYQPDRDKGEKTKIYLKSTIRDESYWDEPTNKDLMIWGYPIWLALYGWLDWQRKLSTALLLDRDWIVVIQSDKIQPTMPFYIPIDKDFLEGNSPYLKDNNITESDKQHWYPQVGYQVQTIEQLIQTGPGIAKIAPQKSFEVKCKYSFYWKFGGCPPKMEKITDPTTLPIYPVPNNEQLLYSLQSPTMPPESYLYKFDIRQDQITETALKRIKRDWETPTSLFTDASRMEPGISIKTQETQTSSEETSDEEKEEENLLKQLLRQRHKRQKLQCKLLQLMQKE